MQVRDRLSLDQNSSSDAVVARRERRYADARAQAQVSKRGHLAGVLLDADRYAELLERLEYLEDSLAALRARDEREAAIPWGEVRE